MQHAYACVSLALLLQWCDMEQSPSIAKQRVARWLRRGADGLCYARIAAAPVLASYIIANPDYKSPQLAATIAGLYSTDKLDGVMARQAAKLVGESTVRKSAELDQKSDKILTTSLYLAVIIREYLNGERDYAKALALDTTLDIGRNIIVNRKRSSAPEGVKVDALPSGKQKQLLYVLGVVGATSPLAEFPEGQDMVEHLVDAATTLSVISGVEMVQSINEQTAELELANYQPA